MQHAIVPLEEMFISLCVTKKGGWFPGTPCNCLKNIIPTESTENLDFSMFETGCSDWGVKKQNTYSQQTCIPGQATFISANAIAPIKNKKRHVR